LPIRWAKCITKGWRPETREGATLTNIFVPCKELGCYQERCYLFGGLSRIIFGSLGYITLAPTKGIFLIIPQRTKVSYNWTLVEVGDNLKKRYGHAAVEWEHKLVIVGGARMFSKETKRRECLGDVQIYDPEDNSWTELHCEGVHFDPRRYHSAVTIGKQLLVYGGINGNQVYCNDLLVLNLVPNLKGDDVNQKYRWSKVRTCGKEPGNLANHTCKLILQPDRYKNANLISLNALSEIKPYRSKLELEGVYFFGGRDENTPSNKLYVLKIGQKVCEWTQPAISGKPPMARYGHSMNYYPSKEILIIYGGRNDAHYAENNNSYFDDVWILTLIKLSWTRWNKEGNGMMPVPRYLHCAAKLSGALIIFGGLSEQNYCGSDVFALEMEYTDANRWVAVEEQKKAKQKLEEENKEEVKKIVIENNELDIINEKQEKMKQIPKKSQYSKKIPENILKK